MRESIRLTACQIITRHAKAVYIYGPPHSHSPMLYLLLLLSLILTCALLVTGLIYFLTQSAWVCCFIMTAMTCLFFLENVKLLSDIKDKEDEIELLKLNHSKVTQIKLEELKLRIMSISAERDEQKHALARLRAVHKMRKMASF